MYCGQAGLQHQLRFKTVFPLLIGDCLGPKLSCTCSLASPLQELLACQLVRAFSDIFAEAGLPLWVRAYDVLVTSSRTALIGESSGSLEPICWRCAHRVESWVESWAAPYYSLSSRGSPAFPAEVASRPFPTKSSLPPIPPPCLEEVVPDALSIHTIKHRSPPGASFSDHFFSKWPRGTPE